MSQLIDKLNRVSRAVAPPMGFRASQPAANRPQMLLIARFALAEDSIGSLADLAAGADAALLHAARPKLGAKTIQKITRSLAGIPWGMLLEDASGEMLASLVEGGCDFAVFPATSQLLAVSPQIKAGRVIQVETSLQEGLLRTINELPVDAALVADEADGPLTWQHLMLFQRFAGLLNKPLLVTVPPNVTPDELKAIWETGIDGVVIAAEAGQPSGKLAELRQAASKFPPRKRAKAEALVPRVSTETTAAAETEEDGEEE